MAESSFVGSESSLIPRKVYSIKLFLWRLTDGVFAVPPERPVVVDRWGRVINATTLGPHQEGDDVLLTCRVLGGNHQEDIRAISSEVCLEYW